MCVCVCSFRAWNSGYSLKGTCVSVSPAIASHELKSLISSGRATSDRQRKRKKGKRKRKRKKGKRKRKRKKGKRKRKMKKGERKRKRKRKRKSKVYM
jgi:hypothetical protein